MFRLHSLKKSLCAAIAGALIALAFAGCAQSGDTDAEREYVPAESPIIRSFTPYKAPPSIKAGAREVKSPVTPKSIIYENGIVLRQVEIDMSDDKSASFDTDAEGGETAEKLNVTGGSINYFIVDGLIDKDVEKKINDTIYDTVMGLYYEKLPPYRGIRSFDFSNFTFEKNIYTRECGNFSNILSLVVTLNVYGTINDGGYDSIYISDFVPLNFDLRTGEQFPLSDMFADNVDYKELVNAQIADSIVKNNLSADNRSTDNDYYYFYDAEYSLISPFKGISDDQKFAVSEYCIDLYFDYNTPEFDTCTSYDSYTSYSPAYFTIPYSKPEISEAVAVFDRFDTDEVITENPGKRVFSVSNYPVKTMSNYYSPEDLGFADEDYQYTTIDAYASVPVDINNETLSAAISERYDAADESLRTLAGDLLSEYKGDDIMISVNYNVTRYGKYLLENDSLYAEVYSFDQDGNGGREFYDNHSIRTLYDEKTGQKVELSDLFREGVDYRTLLLREIKKSESQWTDELKSDEYYLEAIDQGSFDIFSEGISITYEIPDEERYNYYSVTFDNLGVENLTIFD